MKTAVALYDRFDHARAAVEALRASGLRREQISLVTRDQSGHYAEAVQRHREGGGAVSAPPDEGPARHETQTEHAAKASGVGAFLGSLAGVEAALIAVALAGIGPAMVVGGVAALLAGGALGAAAGGLVGALVGVNVGEDEAAFYAEAVRRGATLVAVQSDEAHIQQAAAILEQHGPVNIDERVAQWKETGWTGFDPAGEVWREAAPG